MILLSLICTLALLATFIAGMALQNALLYKDVIRPAHEELVKLSRHTKAQFADQEKLITNILHDLEQGAKPK